MVIHNCFFVTLATLIEENRYKEEFDCARNVLKELMELYPEIPVLNLQELILFSYESHNEPLSVIKRLQYMKVILLLSHYENLFGPHIDDFSSEIKKRKQFCRANLDSKLSKFDKTSIGEITDCLYMEQLRMERELLYECPPCLIKQ